MKDMTTPEDILTKWLGEVGTKVVVHVVSPTMICITVERNTIPSLLMPKKKQRKTRKIFP